MAFVKGRARVKLEKVLLREEILEALHFDGRARELSEKKEAARVACDVQEVLQGEGAG
jgi:hypothetical protein